VEFTIEPISADDIDRARELMLTLHRHEVAVQPDLAGAPARGEEEFWDHYRSRFADWWADGGFAFLAVDGDEHAVGFLFGTEREGHPGYDNGPRVGYVEDIAVLEGARGSGVGRALMDAAREVFRERGFSHVQLSTVPGNDDARAFYGRLGLAPSAVLMLGEL
jgi:GNAT superfamily N-acetyltransferase